MNSILFGGGVLALGVAAIAAVVFFVVRKWANPLLEAVLERYWSARWQELIDRVSSLEADVDTLPRVWEEFAGDAKKAQDRARWHVRRARKELQERGFTDDELDTLDSTLRPIDGDRGNGSGMSGLQDPVAPVPPPPESWQTKALRRKWQNV